LSTAYRASRLIEDVETIGEGAHRRLVLLDGLERSVDVVFVELLLGGFGAEQRDPGVFEILREAWGNARQQRKRSKFVGSRDLRLVLAFKESCSAGFLRTSSRSLATSSNLRGLVASETASDANLRGSKPPEVFLGFP
jgi:hypothetical protein